MLGAVVLTLHLSVELQMAGVTQAIDFKTGRRRRTRLLVRCTHNSKTLIIGSLKYYEGLCILQLGFVFMHHLSLNVYLWWWKGIWSEITYFNCTQSDLLHCLVVYSASFSERVRCWRENTIQSSLNNDPSMHLFFLVMKQNSKVNINQINSPSLALEKPPRNLAEAKGYVTVLLQLTREYLIKNSGLFKA